MATGGRWSGTVHLLASDGVDVLLSQFVNLSNFLSSLTLVSALRLFFAAVI